MVKLDQIELWSLQEKMVYPIQNTVIKAHKGVAIFCTPKGEPLVLKQR